MNGASNTLGGSRLALSVSRPNGGRSSGFELSSWAFEGVFVCDVQPRRCVVMGTTKQAFD